LLRTFRPGGAAGTRKAHRQASRKAVAAQVSARGAGRTRRDWDGPGYPLFGGGFGRPAVGTFPPGAFSANGRTSKAW